MTRMDEQKGMRMQADIGLVGLAVMGKTSC